MGALFVQMRIGYILKIFREADSYLLECCYRTLYVSCRPIAVCTTSI